MALCVSPWLQLAVCALITIEPCKIRGMRLQPSNIEHLLLHHGQPISHGAMSAQSHEDLQEKGACLHWGDFCGIVSGPPINSSADTGPFFVAATKIIIGLEKIAVDLHMAAFCWGFLHKL